MNTKPSNSLVQTVKILQGVVMNTEREMRQTLTQMSQNMNVDPRRLSEALSTFEALRLVRRQSREFVFICNKEVPTTCDQLISELRRRQLKADF